MTTEPSPDYGQPNPVPVRVDILSKIILKERIETKIEEYREHHPDEEHVDFDDYADWQNTEGVLTGLQLALDILEES